MVADKGHHFTFVIALMDGCGEYHTLIRIELQIACVADIRNKHFKSLRTQARGNIFGYFLCLSFSGCIKNSERFHIASLSGPIRELPTHQRCVTSPSLESQNLRFLT